MRLPILLRLGGKIGEVVPGQPSPAGACHASRWLGVGGNSRNGKAGLERRLDIFGKSTDWRFQMGRRGDERQLGGRRCEKKGTDLFLKTGFTEK
jgi:hypothetical protein